MTAALHRLNNGRLNNWRLNNWIDAFVPATPESLALCRIVYAAFFLLFDLPVFSRIGGNPPGFYNPPILSLGAFFVTFPASSWLFALDLLICVSLICVLVGFKTKVFSILVSVAWLIGNSFLYSFGKIDHTIIAVVMPLVMAFSGWGARFSIDEKSGTHTSKIQAWPLTLMALFLAFGFFSAGIRKFPHWVDFDLATQGTRGWLVGGWFDLQRRSFLAPYFMEMGNAYVWELMDYVAVAFEVGFLFSLVRRGVFRIFVFGAVLFHVVNALMLNITFQLLLPVYFLFIPWDRIPAGWMRRLCRGAERLGTPVTMIVLLALFLPLYAFLDRAPIDVTVDGFSHLGIVFSLFPFNYGLYSGFALHLVAAAIALVIAGLPASLPAQNLDALPKGKKIIFFDGVCNLCNGFVDFVIRHRRNDDLMFASLQSPAGELVFSANQRQSGAKKYHSIFLLNADGALYERSDAVLEIVNSLQGPLRFALIAWVVPRIVRDLVYRVVARWRYSFFGEGTSCRVPTADERALFL